MNFKANGMDIEPQLEGGLKPIHPALGVVDDMAYVGVWIPSKVKEKENETEKDLLYLATSKRDLILAKDETLRAKGWKLGHRPMEFENRWPLSDLRAYLGDGKSVDPLALLGEIISTWRTYIEFDDEREYLFQALWVVATYFHDIFNALMYPYFGGIKKSAKTKDLTIHYCLDFNAIFSMNLSTASIYRLIQNAKCTLLIDESEKLSNPERALDFRSLLLGGYKKGPRVYRSDKNAKDQIETKGFDVYAPKALANIHGLEDVLEDRCKPTIMRRSLNREIADREVDINSERWVNMRCSLYRLFLQCWKDVRDQYLELGELSEHNELVNFVTGMLFPIKEEDLALFSSRELEMWRPILALARFFDAEGKKSEPSTMFTSSQSSLTSQILGLALDSARQKQVENMTETGEAILVQGLCSLVHQDDFYPVKMILDAIEANWDEPQKWLTTRWIGNALRRLGFREKRRVGTGYQYRLTPGEVSDLAKRMQLNRPEIVDLPSDPHAQALQLESIMSIEASSTQPSQPAQEGL